MAKNKRKTTNVIPDGMKCYQRTGGGSFRIGSGVAGARIIKTNQKFWTYPEIIDSFKSRFKEVAPDNGAIVVDVDSRPKIEGKEEAEQVPEKFEMVKALDEDGEVIKKGDSNLYNVVGEDGNSLNEKPLRKGKAKELLETVSS